jgi:hypothetical protein
MSTIVTRAGKGSALTWAEADANFTNLNTDKAELNSPTFTGNPTAPTAAVNTNTTQVATTAFVNAEIANDAVAKSGDTMTGALKTTATQIGTSTTATSNFTIAVPTSPNGTMTLARGIVGATTQDIYTINTLGEIKFHQSFGYALGGGSVVQSTDKTTAIIIDHPSGTFTTAASTLTAGQVVRFVMNNGYIAENDIILVNRLSGGTGSSYRLWADYSAAGSAGICIQNITAGSLSEAITANFILIKGAGA